eukprot:3740153-Pyramimonas_sp.AAC.1
MAARVLVGAGAGLNLQPGAQASARAIVDMAKCFEKIHWLKLLLPVSMRSFLVPGSSAPFACTWVQGRWCEMLPTRRLSTLPEAYYLAAPLR